MGSDALFGHKDPPRAKDPPRPRPEPPKTSDTADQSAEPAGNLAAQRALTSACDGGGTLAGNVKVDNLDQQEKLELYQGAEFPQLPGHLTYHRTVVVAFRTTGALEIEIIDNKAFSSQGNVSSASALMRNLQTNLRDLGALIADPVYDVVPRIAQVRASIANARTAPQNDTPLPAEVRLVVTNFGGQSTGITAALQPLGIVLRDVN